jgi:membrane-associated phospholipid phosphatase
VHRLRLRYGNPLLDPAARVWAGTSTACCAVLVVVLGVIFAHQTVADRFDHAVDSPVITWLDRHPGLAGWLAYPGSLPAAIPLTAAVVAGCLLARQLNGAVLAAVAVPAAVGVNDGLCKPLFHRTYLGILSYPSGHTATMSALAATLVILLYVPSQSAKARVARVVVWSAA